MYNMSNSLYSKVKRQKYYFKDYFMNREMSFKILISLKIVITFRYTLFELPQMWLKLIYLFLGILTEFRKN